MSRPPREPDLEPGFASPTIVASRRLMGPNLQHAGLGAVLDVSLDDIATERNAALLSAWHSRVRTIAAALDWPDAHTTQRLYAGGASLFLSAPIDQLMTATEVTESAWLFAEFAVFGTQQPDEGAHDLAAISAVSVAEMQRAPDGSRPVVNLWFEAARRRLNVTFDEASITVGTGAGALEWPLDAVPSIDSINWSAVRDIPIVLVTGSNGKTTVVRMVAAMARAAGHTVGYTCTDGVWIGDAQVEAGDYSGPAGARRVLRDPSVTLAVLETARGGILRRGLALQHAAVAAVVTISADHFGEYGITDLAALADVKLVVARAVGERGTLVYNASIPVLEAAVRRRPGRSVGVVLSDDDPTQADLAQIPATLGGTATHNLLNAAIARAIAHELALGPAAFDALQRFGAQPGDNMGRLMVREVGGVTVVIDYAHNPQSVAALIHATSRLRATRRAIALGTGGDRDDQALFEIAKAAVDSGIIDLFIAKEMPRFLRGRAAGTISDVLLSALRSLGVAEERLIGSASDLDAVRAALAWARHGDLLLLGVHDQRDAVLALIDALAATDWQAGTPLPR